MVLKNKGIYFFVFLSYMILVLRLTVFRFGRPRYDEGMLNLELFTDLIHVYQSYGRGLFLYLFLGNIVIFIPFGFLLPILLKKASFKQVVWLGFLFSLTIETMQFIFRVGIAELDDLILNTIGAAVGYLCSYFVKMMVEHSRKLPCTHICG